MKLIFILLICFVIFVILLVIGIFIYIECEMAGQPLSTEKIIQENENIKEEKDIIITMTTMPKRLLSEGFKSVIGCWLLMDPKPKTIRINIPYIAKRTNEVYVIPEWLNDLEKLKKIEIKRVDDEGPATKYLSTLKDFSGLPDQKILVVDDDMVFYDKKSVEWLVNASDKNPNVCITGWGWILERDDKNKILPYEKSSSVFSSYKPHYSIIYNFQKAIYYLSNKVPYANVDIVLGTSSYLIKPKFFDSIEDLGNYSSFPKEAFTVDDIVISSFMSRSNTKKIVIYNYPESRIIRNEFWNYFFALLNIKENKEGLISSENKIAGKDNIVLDFFKEFF